ncbi:MAG: penicillin-insensitive murein endopeptidase [Kofleriaceae bacterium]|nr:penicillin-insensitive murein endopeptidase [Kofleriaceae bacterium]
MRLFALAVVLVSLAWSAAPAEAKGKRTRKRIALATSAKTSSSETPKRDRSIGAPWSGRLQAPARLRAGDGYHIRRPWRTFATRTTVAFVKQAIDDTLDAFPKTHVLAIGDLSQESGGWISEHSSHQSGRDVDIGLFFKKKPSEYPAKFVRATAATLDAAATWKLVSSFARTQDDDGGVQFIFLDERLQTVLYNWAEKNNVSAKRIRQVQRVLRHEPNHADHIHVRFKCRDRDNACR